MKIMHWSVCMFFKPVCLRGVDRQAKIHQVRKVAICLFRVNQESCNKYFNIKQWALFRRLHKASCEYTEADHHERNTEYFICFFITYFV